MKTAFILVLIIGIAIVVATIYFRKEDKKTCTASGRITKISPVFKSSYKVEYEFTYDNTVQKGFTLADEHVGYTENHYYKIYYNPSKPSESRITPEKYSTNESIDNAKDK